MGKLYLDVVKYIIKGTIEVKGKVDKSDIVGAIFGQTEGLLGEDLDLKELLKTGRIGRIEVEIKEQNDKTIAEITLPLGLDIVESSLIAAVLESIDRVGPYEAHLKINKLMDIRTKKRENVVQRAQELLKETLLTQIPDSRELIDKVKSSVRMASLCYFGEDKLPCGPTLEESDEIIIVEGRADVLNLLKAGIFNVIALEGNKVSEELKELTKKKTTTLFVDGDRGGTLIIKELKDKLDIDYIAKAPPGREVEELTKKEILKSLRKRVPLEQQTNKHIKKK